MLRRIFFICLFLIFNLNSYSQHVVVKLIKGVLKTEAKAAKTFTSSSAKILKHISNSQKLKLSGSVGILGLEEGGELVCQIGKVDNGLFNSHKIKNLNDLPIESISTYDWYIEPEVYFSDKFKPLKDELEYVKIFDNEIVYEISTHNNVIHLTSTLHCRVNEYNELISAINMRSWNYIKNDFNIASILSEPRDNNAINSFKEIAENAQSEFNLLNKANVEEVFQKSEGKLLFITGHFDGNYFYARDFRSNPIQNMSFDFLELDNLSKKYDVYTIYLGCRTGQIPNAAGFLTEIYEKELIKSLNAAFQKTNFFDFFSSLGTVEHPIIIKSMSFDKERVVLEIEINGLSSVIIRMSSSLQPPYVVKPKGLELFLLNTVNFWYVLLFAIVGFISMLIWDNERFFNYVLCAFFLFVLYWIVGKIILYIFY